jgi:hypothetical protein
MGSYALSITSSGGTYTVNVSSNTGIIKSSTTSTYLYSTVDAYIQSTTSARLVHTDMNLALTTASGAIFTDSRGTPRGIEYSSDISATFNNESLVSKRYVDAGIYWNLSGLNIIPKLTTYNLLFANSNQIRWGSGVTYLYGSNANWYLYVNSTKRVHVDGSYIRLNHHVRPETWDTHDFGTTTYWWRYGYMQRLYLDATDIYLSRVTANSMGIYGSHFYMGRQTASPTNNTDYSMYVGEWAAASNKTSRASVIGRTTSLSSTIGYLSFHQTYNNGESQDRIAEISAATTASGVNYGELSFKTTAAGVLHTVYYTRLDSEGRMYVKARSSTPMNIERYTNYSTSSWNMLRLFHETSAGSISDGFGMNVDFSIKDSGGAESIITRLKVTRDGADDRGKFTIQTRGVIDGLSDRFSIAEDGYVFINSGTALYSLHVMGDVYTPNDMHANDFILISDRRLKKNIYTIKPEDGLSMAISMNPVTHQWKSSTRNPGIHLGFIADEVKKIHPSLVKATGDDNKYEGVLYNKISVINNAAIHALVNEIKKLRKRVKELEDNGG